MSLRETTRQRKSLRNIRAFIAALDATVLLAAGMTGTLTLTATVITRLSGTGRGAVALVTVLATAATAISYGWYFGHIIPRTNHPPWGVSTLATPEGVRQDKRWRYDNAGRARSREHTIMDIRQPDGNGRIHHRVHRRVPLDRGPNRTVGHRLDQASS